MAVVFSLFAAFLLQECSTMTPPYCLMQLKSYGMNDQGYEEWKSAMFINGEKMDTKQFQHEGPWDEKERGVKIAILKMSDTACHVSFTGAYETFHSPFASLALSIRLSSLSDGTLIVGITEDEFTQDLINANDTLIKLGIMISGKGKWYRSSAAWVAVVGDPARTQYVQLPRRHVPAVLTFDLLEKTCKLSTSRQFNLIPESVFVGAEPEVILSGKTKNECVMKCLQTSACMTINVIEQPGGRLCQLFKARPGYKYANIQASANTSVLELIKCP